MGQVGQVPHPRGGPGATTDAPASTPDAAMSYT